MSDAAKKFKKADWVREYKDAKEKGPINQNIRGRMARNAEEAFRLLALDDDEPPAASPPAERAPSPPRARAPSSRKSMIRMAAELPLPSRKSKSG